MFWALWLSAIVVPAVWWWVQRPMLNRRAAYGVYVTLIALGLSLLFCLRGVWPELAISGFCLAFITFFFIICTLFSEGENMPYCRRQIIEAALPARPVDSITLPCSLSAEQMGEGFRQYLYLYDVSSNDAGALYGEYKDDNRYWDAVLHQLEGEGWMLQLWTNSIDYLRDRELINICEKHELPIKAVPMASQMNALCVCKAGQAHIFPADAKEDVEFLLCLFDSDHSINPRN